MKKKAILFSTLLLILLLSAGSCLLFLPYLTDTYLLPSITKNLPFSEKNISLLRVSPWKLQGSIALGDNNQNILTQPVIEFNFSPQSILKGKIDSIMIDGSTLRLNLDKLKSENSSDNSQPLILPVSCKTLIIKNSSIIITRDQREHHFIVNGHLTSDFLELENWQQQLSSVNATLQITGDSILSTTIDLKQKDKGYQLEFAAASPDISQISTLLISTPLQGSIDIHGKYNLANNRFSGTGQALLETDQVPVKISFSGQKTISATELSFTASADSFTVGRTSSPVVDLLKVQGDLTISEKNSSGRLSGSVARLTLPSQKIELSDIALSLPLQFPLNTHSSTEGTFSAGKISYDGAASGLLNGRITLNSEKAEFSTEITSQFGPDLQVQCSGYLSLDKQGEVICNLARTHIDSTFFPPFLPLPSESSVEGYLSAKAVFSYSDRITRGNLQLQFEDGTIHISDNHLSSVNIGITFPNFPLLHSDSRQLCTIGSVQLGKIELTDAKIRFRLEDFQSIFIEKSSFSWCDGKVESSSFRLSAEKQQVATTLYCDRLKFTQLLHQFGIEDAEGEGALNGKLPILLSKNGIEFDDGFLFSTPGDTGIVHFNNTASLRQGIGAIDQTPYLDYSMQALENFSYNWTKLTFNSQDKALLIKMQIDGKPAVALPFGYKKGHIVPTEKGQGLQHPIRLDVNFRLPLTDLFHYGKNMKSFMENR